MKNDSRKSKRITDFLSVGVFVKNRENDTIEIRAEFSCKASLCEYNKPMLQELLNSFEIR